MIGTYLILATIAAGMTYVTAVLIKWAAEARSPVRAWVVVFLMIMMAAMLAGALIYLRSPGPGSLVEALWISGALMSISVFPLFVAFLREAQRQLDAGDGYVPSVLQHQTGFVAAVIGLVLLNELLMGWTFSTAAGDTLPALSGASGVLPFLVGLVTSRWFLFTMSAEMMLTAILLGDRIQKGLLVILVLQSAIMALSPPALPFPVWITTSSYLASALMIGLFVYLMEYLYRRREIGDALSTYMVRLLGVYSLMMAGLFVWLIYGSVGLFAASVVLEMVIFFEAVIVPERFRSGALRSWQLRPHWTFALLLGIFVSEIFMGAVLDVQIAPSFYVGALPGLALSGPVPTVLANALSNGFWFLVLITGSTWFLVMMGLEMGALFYFKFRETRNRETRGRMVLTMGSYAAFATFFPSIYYAALFPNWPSGTAVPVLGWSMGIGSAPLAPSVFLVILVTYAVIGSASVLFGRRAVCSVFCTAALMYQGTTINTMSSFNRTSPVARKYLGSRFSRLYSLTTAAIMVSLVAASVTSYLDQIGRLDLTVGGADPTVFLFGLSFGVMWFVLFVTIPYAGNYNCVTMGWCYTGTIAQAFQKIGFFKLKVRDRNVCKSCTTLDCAKSCPVGLVDMPGHFRTKGEFRSSKCCGVGNCVGACPYNNLYISDFRHWVARRLGRSDVPPLGARLPMVTSRTASSGRPSIQLASIPSLPDRSQIAEVNGS
ncbi:MAG: hypothetical protein WA761_03940 [Thermoplasmata archaeon]